MIKASFIGKNIKIRTNNNEFEGEVIDETKNTIILNTKNGKKTIEKKNAKIAE